MLDYLTSSSTVEDSMMRDQKGTIEMIIPITQIWVAISQSELGFPRPHTVKSSVTRPGLIQHHVRVYRMLRFLPSKLPRFIWKRLSIRKCYLLDWTNLIEIKFKLDYLTSSSKSEDAMVRDQNGTINNTNHTSMIPISQSELCFPRHIPQKRSVTFPGLNNTMCRLTGC